MKPRTGDGPLEVVKEGRSIIMRVPLEGGGRLVVEITPDEIKELQEALAWRQDTCQHLIGCHQLLVDLSQVIRFPKLEIGTSLQEFTHTCRLFHTRQFDQDTSGSFQTLDIGRNNSKAVYTRT